jgi:hypothetical protein
MIAGAALTGTMVAGTTTVVTAPSTPAAAAVNDAAFPAAFQRIAQARMSLAKALGVDTETPKTVASLPRTGASPRSNVLPLDRVPADSEIVSPSPTATVRSRETDAQEPAIPLAAASASQSSTAGAVAAQEGQLSMPAKADAEAIKRAIAKAQTTTSGVPHSAKADLYKVRAGATGDQTHLPQVESAPNNAVPHGEQHEVGQPPQGTGQASPDLSIIPVQASANANDPKNTREREHSGAAKVVSTDASPLTGSRAASNPDNSVASVADSDAASAAASVAKVEPNESANFKAELSAVAQATQASQTHDASKENGYVVSAPIGIPANPLASLHSAGGGSKPAGLSEADGENMGSGALSYSASLQQESHGTLVATPTVLEVGVPRGAEGWLKIRAEVGSDGISASLSSASHAGQSILREQLPAINAFLQGEQIHASATLLDKATTPGASDGGSNAALDHGLDREGRQRQSAQAHEEAPELGEDSHTPSLPSGFGVLLPRVSARAGASLSVLA